MIREGSLLRWEGFVEKVGFGLDWQSEWVDDTGGDDDRRDDKLMGRWIETRLAGWWNESRSWLIYKNRESETAYNAFYISL